MSENPYQSPSNDGHSPKTRSTRWLVWSGAVCFVAALVCLVLTIVGMISSFQTIATANTTPSPAELARGISFALIPSYAMVPLAILGLVLVIAGLVVRCPIEQRPPE